MESAERHRCQFPLFFFSYIFLHFGMEFMNESAAVSKSFRRRRRAPFPSPRPAPQKKNGGTTENKKSEKKTKKKQTNEQTNDSIEAR